MLNCLLKYIILVLIWSFNRFRGHLSTRKLSFKDLYLKLNFSDLIQNLETKLQFASFFSLRTLIEMGPKTYSNNLKTQLGKKLVDMKETLSKIGYGLFNLQLDHKFEGIISFIIDIRLIVICIFFSCESSSIY